MAQEIAALDIVPPVWDSTKVYGPGYCVRWNYTVWVASAASQGKQPDQYCAVTNPACTEPVWGTFRGKDGLSATVVINSVTQLPYGTAPYVRNSGTVNEVKLDYGVPAGAPGKDGVSVKGDPGTPGTPGAPGTAATLDLGTTTPNFTSPLPTVTARGTQQARIFDFSAPAAPFAFKQTVPAIAAIEVNTDKTMVLTFPTALPGTNYIYSIQFMNATGLLTTFTWTVVSATATALTIKIRSTVAVLAGAAEIWVTAQYKNT